MTKVPEFGLRKGTGGNETLGERLQGFTLDFMDFEKVRIPDILAPTEHDISPYLEDVRAEYIEWMTGARVVEFGTVKYDVFLGTKLDDYAALLFPKHGKDMVLYGAIALALFFLFDDVIDDVGITRAKKKEYISKLEGLVKGVPIGPGEEPIFLAWQKWLDELRSYASPSLYEIFIGDLLLHIRGLKYQALDEQGRALCPTTHLFRRRDNIASWYFMSMGAIFLEREYALDMRPVIQEHYVKSIVEMLAYVSVVHNELLGLYKDVKSGECNFVVLLQKEYGVSLQDACNLTGRIGDDLVKAMLQMERDLPGLVDDYGEREEAIRRYVHTAYSLIRGTLDWYTISMRYHQKQFFSVGMVAD
jgi:hypothetical protein